MDRQYYLKLAESGLRMPVGADLVLHEKRDPKTILFDGVRLGKVVEEAANRYGTPLAVPLMDLAIEKELLLTLLGVPAGEIPTYHFHACPGDDVLAAVREKFDASITPRLRAHISAIRYVAEQTDLVPVGMSIGPFSLMTKLLLDPITPVYMAGSGVSAAEDAEVRTVEACLELAIEVILRSISAQLRAGAKAIFVCEPAANKVFISPNQLDQGSDIFDRYVIRYNRQVRDLLEQHRADLILHDCGELTDDMVAKLAALDPAILSLGSSRKLWEDARLVSKRTVLFGNLPSKQFYSDALVTREQVARMADKLVQRMREAGHPFILGSECDVLSVPGFEDQISDKVTAMLGCDCGCQNAAAAGGEHLLRFIETATS